MKKVRRILVFCAHSDDEAVGIAGTLMRFIKEGYEVIKIVMSYGESSHPHFKENVVIRKRKSESQKASEFIGIKETIFLGLKDTKIGEMINDDVKNKIKKYIKKYSPDMIFIPAEKDPHPDHRATNKAVLEIIDSFRKKFKVYEFEVWNLTKENKPEIYLDISEYYAKKIRYMKLFVSQWQYMYALWFPVWLRSKKYGQKIGVKFAEKVYRVR